MILIVGSGNVGSLFGGLLTANNNETILLGRSFHIEAIRNNGLTLEGLANITVEPFLAGTFNYLYDHLDEIRDKINYILVTTKAHQTRTAVEDIIPIINKKATFISIQNGIGTEDIIKELYPENTVLRAVTSLGVTRTGDGIINFTTFGDFIIGYNNDEEKTIALDFSRMLSKIGIKSKNTDNIIGAVFSKAIVNCALNPLTAIYGVKNKEILLQEELKQKAIQIAIEAWNVTKKLNIRLSVKNPIKYLLKIVEDTGENTNSMLIDVRNKVKTEIEFLNGKIISLGELNDVDVSMNKEIYNQIISLEKTFPY